MNGILSDVLWWLLSLSALIIGIFMVLHSLNHMKQWRNGEADRLWLFLAYVSGGVLTIPIGFSMIVVMATEGNFLLAFYYYGIPYLLIFSLIPIGLTTVWYILKLREK